MHISTVLFSYIDPVSGVILLQLFIGGCIGFTARFRHKIWGFFAQFFVKQQPEAESALLPLMPSTQSLEQAGLRAEGVAFADSLKHDQSQSRQDARKAA
jgi:hypothetical protein